MSQIKTKFIENLAVTSAKVATDAVTASKIAADAVTTVKILDSNVTANKLASDSVTTVKILDSNVTANKLATDSVTAIKIAADAVTTVKILDGNVTANKLASDSVTTVKILDGNVTNVKLASGIDATKIADGSVTNAEFQYINSLTSNAQDQIDGKVNKAGDTMTGTLSMGVNKITSSFVPNANDVLVNKLYVDGLVAGALWLNPIIDPNLINDSLSTPPGSPVTGDTYIAGASATGAWATFDGYAFMWNGSSWIDLLGRAVIAGDRFGVSMESATVGAGGLASKDDQIAQVVSPTPGSITYTFTVPTVSNAIYVNNALSYHTGHQYDYTGSSWVEFGGLNAVSAGIGLSYAGNALNINMGAGIVQLPSDEVGIDVHASGGLMTSVDNSTSSTVTGAQLAIKLDGSTLSKSASGLSVALLGITNAEISNSAAIAYSKLAPLTASRALVSDGSGFVSVSAVTSATLAFLDATSSVQTQLNAKLALAGGTMSGNINMNGNSITAPTNLYLVGGPATLTINNGGLDLGAYSISNVFNLSMNGLLNATSGSGRFGSLISYGGIAAGGLITGVTNPVAAQDAATKNYVDNLVGTFNTAAHEEITLSAGDITNEYFALANNPGAAESVIVIVGGVIQRLGIDFSLTASNHINFGDGGDAGLTASDLDPTSGQAALIAGDKVYVYYRY